MAPPRLSVFARLPEAGKAKTRLIPAVGREGAANVYDALLRHTLDIVRQSGLDFEVRIAGGEVGEFQSAFGHDHTVVEQGEGDLGARMARVEAPCLIIGSDCPGITPELLRAAANALDDRRVVIGPATDGGYYLIGLREPMRWLFADMEWSTTSVFNATLARLTARGIATAILPELADIDTPEDLAQWPEFQ